MLGAQSNSVDCTITDDTTPDNVKATPTNTENENWLKLYELELSEQCEVQPPTVEATFAGNGTLNNPDAASRQACNTWRYYPEYPELWNHTNCPDPCLTHQCPKFAKCLTDRSTPEDAVIECICQMGTVMKADNSSCIVPPPTTPTPRPVPTMAAAVKAVTGSLSKGASTVIIVFLTVTLLLFLCFCIWTPSRVIHMCEELALLFAHICMLPTLYSCEEMDPLDCRPVTQCKSASPSCSWKVSTFTDWWPASSRRMECWPPSRTS